MSTAKEPMGLDDEPQAAETAPAKDVDGIPYCRKHHCRMKQVSGGRKGNATAYYACPVKDCDCKQQIIKTNRPGVVPPQPMTCPPCENLRKTEVVCERDDKASTASMVILRCPNCGWKSGGMAVPTLAAAHFAHRERPQRSPEPEIGER